MSNSVVCNTHGHEETLNSTPEPSMDKVRLNSVGQPRHTSTDQLKNIKGTNVKIRSRRTAEQVVSLEITIDGEVFTLVSITLEGNDSGSGTDSASETGNATNIVSVGASWECEFEAVITNIDPCPRQVCPFVDDNHAPGGISRITIA